MLVPFLPIYVDLSPHFHLDQAFANQFQTSIQIVKTDNAREFFNTTLGSFFQSHGIIQQSSCVNTPQQNGVAERKNRHILDMSRSLLFQSNVPKKFWGEAVLTATYLINRLPSRVLKLKSPLDVFLSIYPNCHLVTKIPFKLFGCTAFVHVYPQNRGKLDARSTRCIFLGYSTSKKGYKCFCPTTQKFFHSMDVTFFENTPYFSNSVIQGENHATSESHNWETLIDTPLPKITTPYVPEVTEPNPNHSDLSPCIHPRHLLLPDDTIKVYTRRTQEVPPEQSQQSQSLPTSSPEKISTSEPVPDPQLSPPEANQSLELPIAQRKGIRSCTSHPTQRYISYSNLSTKYRACVTALDKISIPGSIYEAMKVPQWKFATLAEYQALQNNGS